MLLLFSGHVASNRSWNSVCLGIYFQVTIVGGEKASPVWEQLPRLSFPPLSRSPGFDFQGFGCPGLSSCELAQGFPPLVFPCMWEGCWAHVQVCGEELTPDPAEASLALALGVKGRELKRASKCVAGPQCCRLDLWRRRGRGEGEGKWGIRRAQVEEKVEVGDVKGTVGRESAWRACGEGQQEGEELGGGWQEWPRLQWGLPIRGSRLLPSFPAPGAECLGSGRCSKLTNEVPFFRSLNPCCSLRLIHSTRHFQL